MPLDILLRNTGVDLVDRLQATHTKHNKSDHGKGSDRQLAQSGTSALQTSYLNAADVDTQVLIQVCRRFVNGCHSPYWACLLPVMLSQAHRINGSFLGPQTLYTRASACNTQPSTAAGIKSMPQAHLRRAKQCQCLIY
jgi:hypothetical protein